jgi:hypothetical protein
VAPSAEKLEEKTLVKDSVVLAMAGHEFALPPLLFVAGWIHFVTELAPRAIPATPWQDQAMPLSAISDAGIKPTLYSVETMCKALTVADGWNLAEDAGFAERNKAVFTLGADGATKLTKEAIEGWCQIPVQVQEVMLAEVDALVFPVMMAHGSSQD